MALIKDLIFQKNSYINIRGIEIDKNLKKFVIRLNIYSNKNKLNIHFVQNGDEYRIKEQVLIDGSRSDALELISSDSLEKAIREKIKTENRAAKKNGLPRVTAEKAQKRIERAVETEIIRLMNEIGKSKFEKIFTSDINTIPVIHIAYNYLKKYVYKEATDA